MLIIAATVMLNALPAPLQDAETWRVEGRCTYSDALQQQAGSTVLVECGEATLSAEGITFAQRGFSPLLMFAGTWADGQLTVTQVARRGADQAEEARGTCQLQWRNTDRRQDLSAIVCTVVAGPRSYIANFLVPRL